MTNGNGSGNGQGGGPKQPQGKQGGQKQGGQGKQGGQPQGQGKQGQGKQNQGKNRRRRSQKPKAVDLWRPVPQLPAPEPIATAADPAALLRSLGDPPLQGQATVGAHYLFAVAERAAGLATALAAAADLLAPADDGE
jgi:hypothetical protein